MASNRGTITERTLYILLTFGYAFAYLFVGFGLPLLGERGVHVSSGLFGFSQLRWLGILPAASLLALCIASTMIRIRRRSDHIISRIRQSRLLTASSPISISIFALVAFIALRNNYINSDGLAYTPNFARDVPIVGAHVTHDEMWELYLHSRAWFYANQYFGWNVTLTYQVLSSLAGAIFILLLVYYSSRISPDRPLLAFCLCLSGGYIQLFFGDVENYTLTTTWIMAYFLASALFIEQRVSVALPSCLLALAMTFHLVAGFLLPSLGLLWLLAWRRSERSSVLLAVTAFGLIIGLTLVFFHFNGLPLRSLWYDSHAFAHGGTEWMLAKPSLRYYWEIANLMFLLVPAWILLVPLVWYKHISCDQMNLHLVAASVFMMLFVLAWRAQLGVYADWNLFAPAALPISFLVWRNALGTTMLQGSSHIIVLLGMLFFIHSFSWVLSNHFR